MTKIAHPRGLADGSVEIRGLETTVFRMEPPTSTLVACLRAKIVHTKTEPLYKGDSCREKSCIDYLSHAYVSILVTFMLFCSFMSLFLVNCWISWQLKVTATFWFPVADSSSLASVDRVGQQLDWFNCTNFVPAKRPNSAKFLFYSAERWIHQCSRLEYHQKPITANSFGTLNLNLFNWRINSMATRSFSQTAPVNWFSWI